MTLRKRQEGVVLVVGLVMLILMTLMAVAAFKFGKSNFIVVANQQTRVEATKAAEQVLEQIVVNDDIALTAGANLFGVVLPGASSTNQVPVDINGDNTADYMVTVEPPQCVKRRSVPLAELNYDVPDDLGCVRSTDQTAAGVEGSGAGESMCSEVVWEVRADARDQFSGDVGVTVVQGMGQRVATTAISTFCD